jgi:hypothetical protein
MESNNHSIPLLRLKSESAWSAHQDHRFNCFADSAEEVARLLDAQLCYIHV